MFPRRKYSAPAHKKEPEPRTNFSKNRMIVERLPARILLSADLPGLDLVALDTTSPSDFELEQRLRAALLSHESKSDIEDQILNDTLDSDDDVVVSRVLIVVDPQVNNYQQLIDDITNTAEQDTQLTILVLDPGQDGLAQISNQLSTLNDIDAVHLFSHSNSSGITLGNEQLSLANLADNTAQLELWKSSLSDDADILIYGCDLAGSSDGQALIEQISQLTGADVAASDNTTGTASAGGDWELEYRTGEINSEVPISLAMQDNYASVLGTFTVLNINDSGVGSLRQAITDANNAVGADTIEFNIAGGGPHVIALSSALPSITDEVFINGTTEPDFIGNGSNPIVVIDGNDLNADGINVTATGDNTEIRGLVIRDFVDNAISIDAGADNVVVAGNFLGSLDTNGLEATGESIGAVIVYVEGGNAVIGGNTDADRNVIAGGANGVVVTGALATGAQVSGNFIGVDETGNNVIAITFDGVRVEFNAANAIIGGATTEHGNLIAGVGEDGIHIRDGGSDLAAVSNNVIGVSESGVVNLGVGRAGIFLQNSVDDVTINDNLIAGTASSGIEIDGTSSNTIIEGNVIGTDATLSYNWGTGENGILLKNGAIDSTIGSWLVGEGNVVAHSGVASATNNAGIAIQGASTGNDVFGNSIYGNGGAGIDLSVASNDGVDPNDAGDVDAGGNNKQNVAVFSTASVNGTGDFSYDVDTSALNAGTYEIDFYANDDLDGGEVEGKRYLTSITLPGSGSAAGTLSGVVLAPGEYVTLTATDAVGNTSEFSNYVVATSSAVSGASPDDLSVVTTSAGGLSINQDGGNDVYLQADDGGAILGGLTSLTVEAQLTLDSTPSFPHVMDYAVPGEAQELSLLLSSDTVRFSLGGTSVGFADTYSQLRDGESHTLSVSWDGSTGDLKLYIDGVHEETITGFQTGYTVVGGGTLVVGNDQGTPGANFQTSQSVHGTLSDIRLFDQARSDNDILANYDSTLPYDETGMLANWTFDALSTHGVVTDSVASNSLSLLHIAEPGFTASSAALVLNVNENAVNGTVVGSVTGSDPEREALIATLLANNTGLYYNAETEKFYQHADDSVLRNWTASRDNALASTLNGVSGQLVTIDSATENQQVVDILNAFGSTQAYILASDVATEGEWRQGDLASDTLFWQGAGTGYSVNGSYANWDASNPNNFSGSQHYAKMFASNGLWDDVDGTSFHGSVIEYDANAVLGSAGPIDQQPLSYSIIGQSIGGAFTIDADAGTLSVANSSSLDYELLTAHVVTVRVTDVDGNTYDEAFTVSLRNLTESNYALTNLSSGIELNTDGGNDAFLIADDGGAILGDATEFTVEINFSTQSSAQANLISYVGGDGRNDLNIVLEADGTASIIIDNAAVTGLSGIDYNTLRDGDIHHIALSWDNTNGDWFIYVDGDLADSGTGLSSGDLLNGSTGVGGLVFGQTQDSLGGGFDSNEIFSGTLYDVRIWNESRNETEISLTYQNKFDTASLPSGLIANWQMDGFNGSNAVVDIVSGNNLSIGQAIGAGFINSTTVVDLNVDENSADGISVGFVVPSSTYVVDDLVRDGSFVEAADPLVILDTYFENGSGAGSVVGAWTVSKESVDLISIDHAQSPLGGRVIELDGNLPGGISQTLSTEVGKQYQVLYAMSGDFDNGDEFKQVRVSAAGTSEDHSMSRPLNWIWGHPDYFETRSFTFVADSANTTLTLESLSSAGNSWGPMIGDVQVLEIPQSVQTILNNDPTLSYDAATDKFYRYINTPSDFNTAIGMATSSTLNGVNGQLLRVDSDYENELFRDLVLSTGNEIWLGAEDDNVDGNWSWLEASVSDEQFWTGGDAGSALPGQYASDMFLSEAADETRLRMLSNGGWGDNSALSSYSYVVEWDVSDVLSNVTFSLTDDAGGRFAIDSNTGEVTVADASLIDYETATTHNVDVQVIDAAGNSYAETMTIKVDNGIEPTQIVPAAQSTNEDTPLVFSTGNGNAVTVNDTVASENTRLQVFISTNNNGTLTLSQTTGLSILGGSNGGTFMTIQGTESDINAAFEGMTFDPVSGFAGSVTLDMTTSLGVDMTGHFTFESGTVSGSTVSDQSVGLSQNGTLNGNAAVVNDIERGEVLILDGNRDYVEIAGMFGNPADVTLAAWVNVEPSSGHSEVLSLGDNLLVRINVSGELVAYHRESGVSQKFSSGVLVGSGWNHVAVAFDDTNDQVRLYLNGAEVASRTETDSIVYERGTNTFIGAHGFNETIWDFEGMIDDARIYSRALSAEEIAAIAADNTTSSDSVAITVVAVNDAPTFNLQGELVFTGGDSGYGQNQDTLILSDGTVIITPYDSSGDTVLLKLNADGTVDTSFGVNGYADNSLIGYIQSVAEQADGKILVSGNIAGDIFLARYNINGTIDSGFGSGGVTTLATGTLDEGTDIAIQPDGSIVLVGEYGDNSIIARFTNTGTLDVGFSFSGIASFNLGGTDERLESVTILNDGSIIAVGETHVVKLDSGGAGDFLFDTDGVLDLGYASFGVTVQTDGKFVVSGGDGTSLLVARFNADGTVDTDFGTSGTASWSTTAAYGHAMVQQSDGKLVVAGHTDVYPTQWVVVRFNTDGTLDTNFGTSGAWVQSTSIDYSQLFSVSLYNDGVTERIVVGGYTTRDGFDNDTYSTVVQLNRNGTLYSQFGTNTLDGNPTFVEDSGTPVVLDDDVKIFDAELSDINNVDNFDGATLTLARNLGTDSDDIYTATGTLSALIQGGNLAVDSTTIGAVTANSAGTLVLTFNNNATNALVNSALRKIAYSNSSNDPDPSVQIDWTFSDGNSADAQGTGPAETATGSTNVDISRVNDSPEVTAPGSAFSFTEQGSLNIHGTGFSLADVDNNGGTFTAIFAVGEGRVLINVGDSGVLVSSGNSTDTVMLSGTLAQLNALLDGSSTGTIEYFNNQTTASDAPSASTTITLTVNDQGNTGTDPGLTGGAGDEEDFASQTINITAVNDAPALLGAELVTNGDFATGDLTDWASSVGAGFDDGGLRFGGGNSAGPHTAMQTISTVAGETYSLSFDHRDHRPSNDSRNQQLTVTVDGSSNLLTTESILSDTNDQTYIRYSFTFTADSATSTITFTDTSDNAGSYSNNTVNTDGYIDNISIRQIGGVLSNTTFVEYAPAVVLDSDLTLFDAEIDAGLDDFDGATLTLVRNGSANANDVFSATGTLVPLAQGSNNLIVGATTIGSVTTNSGGTLVLTFNSNATNALVNSAMQQIAYSNSSNDPDPSVQIDWTFSDGNSADAQGTGPAETATGSTTVGITPVNDSPQVAINTGTTTQIGGTVTITATMLTEADPDDSGAGLTYTVTGGLANGQLELTTNVGVSITSFTQSDIDAGIVVYVHDGLSGNNDSFGFSLADGGEDGTAPATATFNIAIGGATLDSYSTNEDNSISVDAASGVLSNDGVGGSTIAGNTVIGFDGRTDTDGNATWTSDTGSLNLALTGATYTTSPTNAPAGITAAFDFDGSGGATSDALDSLPEIDGTQSATLETWLRLDSEIGNQVIFDTGSSSGGITLVKEGAQLTLHAAEGGFSTEFSITNANSISPADWHHVAVTIDMDAATPTVTVWVDGNTVIQRQLSQLSNWADGPFGLAQTNGTSAGGYTGGIDGQIANFRIHDEVLSSADINSNAANPGAGNATPYVASYDDSSTTGNVVVNSDGSFSYDPNGQFEYLAVGQSTTDTFTYTYDNGTGEQEVVTVTMTIDGVNDTPVVDLDADDSTVAGVDFSTTWTEDAGPVLIADSDATLSDVDTTNLTSLTVTLNNVLDDGNEFLAADTTGTSVVASYDAVSGVLTLSGSDTVSNYQQVLRTVTYDNTFENPGTANRSISFVASDGVNVGPTAFASVSVSVSNDAPTIASLAGNTLSYNEGDGAVAIDQLTSAAVTDVDSSDFDTGTLTVSLTTGSDSSEDVLSVINTGTGSGEIGISSSNVTYGGVTIGTFVGGSGGNDLVITLNANADAAATSALAQQISYENTDTNNPTNGDRTVRYVLTDGDGGTSANYDTTIEFTAVNDAPVNTVPSTQTVAEETQTAITGISVSDVDAASGNITTQLQVSSGVLDVTLSGAATISAGSNGSDDLTILGSVTDVNATLASLQYTGNTNINVTAADSITVTTDDGGNTGSSGAQQDVDNIQIDITAVNDAPVNTVPGTQTVAEETQTAITGISVSDVDAAAGNITTQLQVSSGVLDVTLSGAATISAGANSSADLTILGSVTDVNATLASLQYTGNTNVNGTAADTLTMTTDDGGNTGSGGAQQDIDTVQIDIAAVNDAPINTVPGTQSVAEETQTDVNGISVSDVDAATGNITTQLQVSSGVLDVTLSGTATISAGVNSSADLTILGSVTDVNATLASLQYTGNTNINGTAADTLTVTTDDGGNTGTGGAQQDVDNIQIDIAAVNDAPVNTVPATQTVAEDTQTVITGISVVDVDAAAGNITTQLQVSSGALDVTLSGTATISAGANSSADLTIQGSVIDVNATLASLLYTGNTDINGVAADTLTVTTNDGGNTGSGGARQDADTIQIDITAVNDAPVITSDGSAATALINVAENQTDVTTVVATDVDTGDVPTYAITGGLDAALFAVNLNSGVLTFNTTPDFETFTDANKDGVYEVEITADDGNSGTDVQLVSVTVTDVNEAPVITSDGAAATASVTVAENQMAVTTVTANDADLNDVIVFSITGGDDAGQFQIDSATGALKFTAVQDFEIPSDSDSNGQYEVEVSASDLDGLLDTQHIAVVVTSVPELNALLPIEHTVEPPYVAPQVVPAIPGSETVDQNETKEGEVESNPDPDPVSEPTAEPESTELSFPVDSLPLEFPIESITSLEEIFTPSPARAESANEPENRLSRFLRIWVSAMSEGAQSFQDELDRQRFFDELSNQMDGYDEQAEAEVHKKKLVAQVTTGLSITLTAGFVSWILRAGSMVASLLTSMPAWRQLDLLPILSAREDEDTADMPNDAEVDNEDRQDDDPDERVDSLLRKSG